MLPKKKIIAIVGPTASGKTQLSILLAEKLASEIISADARQIYKYLNIGTAKPSIHELQRITHHFINILNPDQEYNAAEYGQQARAKIGELLEQNKTPILVGGSGLYVRAVIDGFFNGPGKNTEIRKQLEEEMRTSGIEVLFEKLKEVDPVSASKMDMTKSRRVVRALEIFYITGMTISDLHLKQNAKPSFEVIQFGLEWDRKLLYERINNRVEKMLDDGLVEEARGLINKGYSRKINALNTVGYKEAFDFIEGKMIEKEMVRLIKQNTRHYAKRQFTWFRSDKRIRWILVDHQTDWNGVADAILKQFIMSH